MESKQKMDYAASNDGFRINVFNFILKHLQLGLYCLVSNKITSTSHYLALIYKTTNTVTNTSIAAFG